MAKSPTSRPFKPPAKAPTNSTEGKGRIIAFGIEAFDRRNGTGTDWKLLADSLFRAAFDQLDRLPEADRLRMAEKVHAAAYGRFMATEAGRDGDIGGAARPTGQTPGVAPTLTTQPGMIP